MTDERNPERVAGDDANTTAARLDFADKAEALLRLIMSTLGWTHDVTLVDLIAGLRSWIALVQVMTRDPEGRLASIWWRAYDGALARSSLAYDAPRRQWAAEEADHATKEFLRRFPPLVEDAAPRDTIDDVAALQQALDEQTDATADALVKADRLEAIANAAEERAEKAERELTELRASVIVPLPKPERVEPGQRWLFTARVNKISNGDAFALEGWFDADAMLKHDDYVYLGNAQSAGG